MLPPIPISTLQNNPRFAALHQRLTNSKLNPDGSIELSSSEARAQALIEEDLLGAQTTAAKKGLLKTTVPCLLTAELPDELLDLITLLHAPPPLPFDLQPLLTVDPAPLGPLLSIRLCSLASALLNIAASSPTTELAGDSISARRTSLAAAQTRLHSTRLALAVFASSVLEAHRAIISLAIRMLESYKHGSLSRAVGAESAYLAAVAEGMSARLGILRGEAYAGVYDEEVMVAIDSYRGFLKGWKTTLEERDEVARDKLGNWEGKEWEKIRERYVGLWAERERVKSEIDRLEGG